MTDLFLGYPDEGITNWIKDIWYPLTIPLCFEALEDVCIAIDKYDEPPEISLLYSFDNKTWQEWDYKTGTDLKTREKLYLKSKTDNAFFSSSTGYYSFYTSGKVNVSGNIMSLLYNDFKDKKEITAEYCFNMLFASFLTENYIVNASKLLLPATTLAPLCYYCMFEYNDNLIYAPEELSATNLGNGSYCYMFDSCSNLISIPKILHRSDDEKDAKSLAWHMNRLFLLQKSK